MAHKTQGFFAGDARFDSVNLLSGTDMAGQTSEELREEVVRARRAARLAQEELEHTRNDLMQLTLDLRGQATKLRRAEAKYRHIFENAVVGLYQSSPEGRLLAANPEMARILGYDSPDVLIESVANIAEDLYMQPLARRQLVSMLDDEGVVSGLEVEIRRKDGTTAFLSLHCRAIRNSGGSIEYLEGAVEDITNRKETEVALAEKERQLQHANKMEAVGKMVAGLAHDFNNMLTVITGFSGLSLEALDESDPIRADLQFVCQASAKAADLTRQLLAFSRQQVLQPRMVDLDALVGDFEHLIRRTIPESVDVQMVLDAQAGTVKADPGQIEQVLLNLAVNGRDAMPDGGVLTIETGTVELDESYPNEHAVVTPGRYVMLAVSDTGIGMDDDTLAQIFEPFFTTKAKGEGTGLGLATTYGIVKQSGGYIWAYSEPGNGTTFKIYLPWIDQEPEPLRREEIVTETRGGSETVLVAEDDELVLRFVVRTLEEQGFRVLAAQRPADAIEACIANKDSIQVLVTDLVMPGISGIKLREEVEQIVPAVRTLCISGYADKSVLHNHQLDGNIDFLGKPFSATALIRKVREILDRPED